MLKLKSTGQRVFQIGERGDYREVFRSFNPGEGTRSQNKGEIMLVRRDRLVEVDSITQE